MPAYGLLRPAVQQSDLTVIAGYLLPLMLRNMASDGFVFTDPANPQAFSSPGCIVASPSFDRDLSSVTQNYVWNWVRDAAVTAREIACAGLPAGPGGGSGPLGDYVSFAALCQSHSDALDVAVYTIEGQVRPDWARQNDGPALQVLALLAGFGQLDAAGQDLARSVIAADLGFVLARYRDPAVNLWEEVHGQSFFTRSVQLRCLTEIAGNSLGVAVPPGVADAVAWLTNALAAHWNGTCYVSVLDADNPRDGYDPNIDIVAASVYGWVDCADPKLLATAGLLRRQWADPSSPQVYPVNEADGARGLGPLLGRYPGDVYDGDTSDSGTGHPWALCTANYAELYYLLAGRIAATGQVPWSGLAADFFSQAGVGPSTAAADAVPLLVAAADGMLRAIVYHSDHLELSEQFDKATGFEKSVRDLTWSYAAFLSAIRARAAARAAAAPVTPAPAGGA